MIIDHEYTLETIKDTPGTSIKGNESLPRTQIF